MLMIDFVSASETIPFSVAIGLMVALALFEGLGLLIGLSLSAALDAIAIGDIDLDVGMDADVEIPSPFFKLLGWLNIGKVPILVLLVIFLTAFGLSGYVIQFMTLSTTTLMWPAVLASIPAFIFAVAVMKISGKGLAAIIPKDETEVISSEEYIGKVGTITTGTATSELPAEAKLEFKKQVFYVMVTPHIEGETFTEGTKVLLIDKSGTNYRVIDPPADMLL